MEDVIRASGLDWTLVRAARLTGGRAAGQYRIAPDYPARGGTKISRADVAAFIRTALTDGSYAAAAPALAY
jgi:uncharacterized protein YbjT (DUF2867 family)